MLEYFEVINQFTQQSHSRVIGFLYEQYQIDSHYCGKRKS